MYLANETKPCAKLFADIGLQTSEEFRRARQIALTENFNSLIDLVERIKPCAQINLEQYVQEIEKEKLSATQYPETKRVLEEVRKRNLKLGLISNLASPYKEPFFKLGLYKYFHNILFSCDVGLMKPNPKIYVKMIENLEVNPSQAIMIGDKISADVDGPKSIGMNAVLIDRKNTFPQSIVTLDGIFQYV